MILPDGNADERPVRWACPRHRDARVKFNGGLLWCVVCKRDLPDAVQVEASEVPHSDAHDDEESAG